MTDKPLSEMKGEELFERMRERASLPDFIKKKFDPLLTEIQSQQDNMNNLLVEIRDQRDKANALLTKIQEKQKSADESFTDIMGKQSSAINLTQTMRTHETNVGNAARQIRDMRDSLRGLSSKTKLQCDDADELLNEIKNQRDSANKSISDANESLKEKNEQMNELVEKIEGLLPGATSAGLAETFHQAQKQKAHWLYWVGFIGSLFCVAVGYGYFFHNSLSGNEPFTWGHVLARATIGIPLLWIAWYCQRSLSQMNRIREEYHHKERVMRIYEGFSKQINSSDSDIAREHNVDLVSAVIKAIERNPADVLDPSATMLDLIPRRKNEQKPDK